MFPQSLEILKSKPIVKIFLFSSIFYVLGIFQGSLKWLIYFIFTNISIVNHCICTKISKITRITSKKLYFIWKSIWGYLVSFTYILKIVMASLSHGHQDIITNNHHFFCFSQFVKEPKCALPLTHALRHHLLALPQEFEVALQN